MSGRSVWVFGCNYHYPYALTRMTYPLLDEHEKVCKIP